MDQTTPRLSPKSDDSHETTPLVSRGCCFFINFPCFNARRPNNWERISTLDCDQIVGRNWWDKRATVLKKMREWSELMADLKWKTFIRRFNRIDAGRTKSGKFQYDPMSYTLNFDEGGTVNSMTIGFLEIFCRGYFCEAREKWCGRSNIDPTSISDCQSNIDLRFSSEVQIEGLETLDYFDNLLQRQKFTEQADAITLDGEIDRVYFSTPTKIAIIDH